MGMIWTPNKPQCEHKNAIPSFDEEEAKGLPANEIRTRWPRFSGRCPDCGEQVIVYASFSHYTYGDW